MGVHLPDEPDPGTPISLTYQEFLAAVARMREVDFPIWPTTAARRRTCWPRG
jgi:hypothetical protein